MLVIYVVLVFSMLQVFAAQSSEHAITKLYKIRFSLIVYFIIATACIIKVIQFPFSVFSLEFLPGTESLIDIIKVT